MNETALTLLIALTVPAVALGVIAIESHLTGPLPADEPECFVTLLPNPAPPTQDPTRKTRLNASFKPR